jgi:hypothetical protein
MGFFEKLGWSRRSAQPVGHELETSGRSDEGAPRWQRWLLRGGLLLLLVAITAVAFPRGEVYEYTVQVGDPWRQSTLKAQFDFPIYIDEERVEAKRDTVRQNTPPYFREVPNAIGRLDSNRDTLRRQVDRALEAFASYRYHRSREETQAAREDSTRYVRFRRNALATLTASQWRLLAERYVQQVQGLQEEARGQQVRQGERLDRALLDEAFRIGSQLLNIGVMDRSRDSISTDVIIIRNEEDRVQRRVNKDNVYGLNEAYAYVEDQLRETFQENPDYARIAFSFFRAIFQPSIEYMRTETLQERRQRARNVTPIQGGVEAGEVIVRKGEIVTEEIKRKLTSLERVRNERKGPSIVWKQTLGEALFALLGFSFFFFYLYLFRPDVWREDRDVILITLLLGFITALFGVGVRLSWANLYAVPVALASVLLTIVFNSRIGLFGTIVLAFSGGQMLGLDLEYTLATFFAGAFGIFSVRDIKNRGQFFVSAGIVFIGYLLVLTASWLFLGTPTGLYGRELIFAAIGSSFTITASLFLWALERMFDITTDLTLLELSDTNNKLLKELSLRAPGSFNHTLQVANLAEAAADRIGAHTLLTRVGALYHDIGKMRKPEYFVENQRAGMNPHDQLKPRMSALIIASHVKEGLEMGEEHNLPEEVLKFIPTHHGTARIEYFYRKAVGASDEEDSPVLESEFRYPGPKPHSKETGILMLADSVEAASRSLDDPSHNRLKSLIDLIFQERIEDGQLDETDLTFQDLRLIKETFLKMLLGIYHVRVKYPDQEEEEPEETEPTVVAVEGEAPYQEVTIDTKQGPWGVEPSAVEPEGLDAMPGLRDPREPRPELAEASPHHRSEDGGDRRHAHPDVPASSLRKPDNGSGPGRNVEDEPSPPSAADEEEDDDAREQSA